MDLLINNLDNNINKVRFIIIIIFIIFISSYYYYYYPSIQLPCFFISYRKKDGK